MDILITGKDGYISSNLKGYLSEKFPEYKIRNESIRNIKIESLMLNGLDVVVHTAAIVHQKQTPDSENFYNKINTNLTYELALRAKQSGVGQFIFFSTMAVFENAEKITSATNLKPKTYYGKSKLAAENLILKLQDENFKISIIRPPMVYGPNCPGNYALLSKISKKIPVFPLIDNKRSMIYIDNLLEITAQIIFNKDSGIFHPHDKELINTGLMVKEICLNHTKKIILTKYGAGIIKAIFGKNKTYNKIFGNLYYDDLLANYRDNSYQIIDFKEAIKKSEKVMKKENMNTTLERGVQ